MKAQYARMLKADPIHRIPKGAEVKVGPKEGVNYTIWFQGRLGMVPINFIEPEQIKNDQISMEVFDESFNSL